MYNYDELFKDFYKKNGRKEIKYNISPELLKKVNQYLEKPKSKYDEVLENILSQCEKGYTHLQGTNYVMYKDKLLCSVKKDLNFAEDCFTEPKIENGKFVNKIYFVNGREEYKKDCRYETFQSQCSFKVYETDFYTQEVVFKNGI